MIRTVKKSIARQFIAALLTFSLIFMGPLGSLDAFKVKAASMKAKVKRGISGKGALALGAAVGAGAMVAAPFIASSVAASGVGAAVAGTAAGVTGVVGGAAGIISSAGGAIWGAVSAAGGTILGALGAVGTAIGGALSGIAGFIGGIVSSPIFIPALIVLGIATIAYILWKKRKRQNPSLNNGVNLPSGTGEPIVIGGTPDVGMLPGGGNSGIIAPSPDAQGSYLPSMDANTPYFSDNMSLSGSGSEAHQKYVDAYNKYIKIITAMGNSENPDEEMKEKMRSPEAQRALRAYREAYYNWQKVKNQ